MNVGRSFARNTSIHGIHVSQHVAKPLVVDVMGDKLVGRPQETLAKLRNAVACWAQIKEVYLVGQLVKGRHIALQLRALMWKMLGKTLYKTFFSLGHTISGVGGSVVNLVHAKLVYGL